MWPFRRRGTWPADPALRAHATTAARWDEIERARRLRRPLLAVGRWSRAGARALFARITGRDGGDGGGGPAEPRTVRSDDQWVGRALLVSRPTSSAFTAALPVHRRHAPVDLLGSLVDGWVHVEPDQLRWFASSGTGATSAVVVDAPDVAGIELVDLGRRRGGLTVTTVDGDQLWLVLVDRRKCEGILGRLRYRS